MLRLAGAVALAPAQLVGIAQPGRTRAAIFASYS